MSDSATRFVDDAVHELRTPLTVVKGNAEMLRQGLAGDLTSEQLELVDALLEGATESARILEDLLDSSRLRAGRLHFDRRVHDASELVERVRKAARRELKSRKTLWIERVDRGVPPLLVDLGRAARLLGHVVSSAVKLAPEGSTITFEARRADSGNVEFGVAVAGGVALASPPGCEEHEPFAAVEAFLERRSGAPSARELGLGIGIELARDLAVAEGGVLRLTRRGRDGATFTVELRSSEPWFVNGDASGRRRDAVVELETVRG